LNLASGATEAGLCIKAMIEGIAPGICNLKNPVDPEMNFVFGGENQHKEINKMVKVAVGFGANNAALAFKKYNPNE
jgi:3-oxoacyl-(acyl-carrier-protein) synthase